MASFKAKGMSLISVLAKIFVFACVALHVDAKTWNPPNFPSVSLDGYAIADDVRVWNTNLTVSPLGEGSNDTVFVVPSTVHGISLMCNATYPIEWAFHRERWSERIMFQPAIVNSRQSDPVTLQPVWFSSEIRLTGSDIQLTGTYTCQKCDHSTVSKSVYIFWEGSSPPYLTLMPSGSQRRELKVKAKEAFTLPCTVSRPDVLVQLTLRRVNETTKNVSLTDTAGVEFDPAQGFTISSKLKDRYGVYNCSVGESEDASEDSLEFNVKEGEEEPHPEFDEKIGYDASFKYDSGNRQFVCCSNNGNKPPKVGHYYCSHPTTCQLQKHALHKLERVRGRYSTKNGCAFLKIRRSTAGVLRCKGENIDIVREYFFPQMQFYRRRGRNETLPALVPFFSWEEAQRESDKLLSLTNMTEPFYVGEKRRFVCRASRFYYSHGIHWTINFHNETIHVQGNQTQHGKNLTYGIFYSGNLATIEIESKEHLRSLTCNAPVWNSTNWGTKTLYFNVTRPTPPSIEGSKIEDVTFSTKTPNRTLTCKYQGEPMPRIIWKRNGEIVLRSFVTTNKTTRTSTLNITSFNANQWTVTCSLSNLAGNVSKTFNLRLVDSLDAGMSGFGKVALYGLGTIGVVMAIVGSVFLAWKIKTQRDAIRHLANVAFKDVNDLSNSPNNSTNSSAPQTSYNSGGYNGNGYPSHNSLFGAESQQPEQFGKYSKM